MKTLTILFFISMLLLAALATPAAVAATTPDGTFTAALDPLSFTFTTVGANCLLTVQGTLTFSGKLTGVATGTTRALVFASCPAVQANPPGAFADVFRSKLTFTGTNNGTPVTNVAMIYQGRTAVGGAITGQMRLGNGRHGILYVEGKVAQGGSYWFRTP